MTNGAFGGIEGEVRKGRYAQRIHSGIPIYAAFFERAFAHKHSIDLHRGNRLLRSPDCSFEAAVRIV